MKRVFTTVAVSIILVFPIHKSRAEDLSAGLQPELLNGARGAVDRGLQFISQHQNADGSFGNEAGLSDHTTSLVVLAFLSQGHQPGQGRYGKQLERAIDWLLSIQRDDGSFSTKPPNQLPRWTHSETGIALCEASGFTLDTQFDRVGSAIRKAIAYTRKAQQSPKVFPSYNGGWSYSEDQQGNQRSDWSNVRATCWELYFLRSAHNAGFEVPQAWVDEGVGFIERCYRPGPLVAGNWLGRRLPVAPTQGVFFWYPLQPPGQPLWADTDTTAAGMLAFQLHGRRGNPLTRKTGDWIVEQPIADQGAVPSFYYTCYITSHAISQIGGKQWDRFYPRLVGVLLPYQEPDGHFRLDRSLPWSTEPNRGPVTYTALAILCLTLPDQLLPIHQR